MQLYRYSEVYYDNIGIFLETFEVIKETPCGGWINHYGKKKFINFSWRKQFAYKTKEQALENLIRRKKRQRDILDKKLFQIDETFKLIQERKDDILNMSGPNNLFRGSESIYIDTRFSS